MVQTAALPPPSALTGDAAAGRAKAGVCVPCHGRDGLSKAMNAPNIAGQVETYLVDQLKAYRDGTRNHQQMSIVAKDLSDEDIANLAAWYGGIAIAVTVPE